MINRANIFCTLIKRSFLFTLISFSLVYAQDSPPEFEFNISIYQSFYFFLEANIDGEVLVEGEDWIASFSIYDETMGGQCSYIGEDLDDDFSTLDCYDVDEDGVLSEEIEVCVGSFVWSGEYTTVPVMGTDGTQWTVGYMHEGELPKFKIYDASEDEIYNAVPSIVYPWSTDLAFYVISVGVFPDCIGDLGGEAFIDSCDQCVGGNTGLEENYADIGCGCFEEFIGPFYEDLDGDGLGFGGEQYFCENPGLGWSANQNDPDPDCYYNYLDCNSECGGMATVDDCGVCSGGTTGLAFNGSIDCNGDCFGSAFVDDCNECVGGNTGTGPCDYVSELPEEFEYYQSTMQAFYYVVNASIGTDGEFLSTNDWIGLFNGNVCVGTVRWDGTFTTIPAMGYDGSSWTEGYLETGDYPTFKIYDASESLYYDAFPGEIVEILGTEQFEYTGFGNNKFYYVYDLNAETPDCNGVFGGTAYFDTCGICSGGSTGLEPDSNQDCAGICFGDAFADDCGVCADGTTGNIPNADNLGCGCYLAPPSLYYSDFDSDGFGTGLPQSFCDDPGEGWVTNNLDPDPYCSNPDINTSLVDDCGICEGYNAIQDCAGICFGSSEFDDCGVCNGDNSTCSSPSVFTQNVIVNEDEESIIILEGIDPNDDELIFSVLSYPTHGSISIGGESNSQVVYSPEPDYHGSDQFSYIAFDGQFYSNVGYINIDVQSINDAPVASSIYTTIDEDSDIGLSLEAIDVDGDQITFNIISPPENGILVINGDQAIYTPNNNFSGEEIIEFTASDGYLESEVAMIYIEILPVNDAPVASDQTITLNEDTETQFIFSVSDGDNDDESLSILLIDSPEFGLILSDGIEGTIYPYTDVYGEFSVSFKALDGEELSEVAILTVNIIPVNDPPVLSIILDQEVDEDQEFNMNLSASDVDSDNLNLYLTTSLINATGIISGNLLTITPDNDYNGIIEVNVSVTDGELISSKSFNLTVNPINDPPVISTVLDQTTNEDTILEITISGDDIDGDNIVYWVNSPNNISAFMNGNELVLAPDLDWYGGEIITVNVTDGEFTDSTSFLLTVLSVNDPPVISSIENQISDEDQIVVIELSASDNDGDNITFGYLESENVSISIADSTLYITPEADYNGLLTISASATDGEYTVYSNFSIEVLPVNDPPVIEGVQSQEILENEIFEYQINASDVDEDNLVFYAYSSGYSETEIESGLLTVTPNSGWSGFITLTVVVSDGEYYSEVEFDIEVLEVNDPPVSYEIESNTLEDNVLNIDLLGSDPDTEQDQLTYIITTPPQNGEVQISGSVATYSPSQDYNGLDEFFYSVYDLYDYSEPSSVTIDVLPFNDAPFAEEVTFSVDSDPYEFDLSPFIGDIDGDELEIDFITQSSSEDGIPTLFDGLIVENGGTSFTYYKPDGMVFFDIILYKVKDGLSESGIYTINFNLFGRETPRDLAPIAFDQDVDVLEDISQEITLVGFDVLNDFSEESTFEITQSPQHGSLASSYTTIESGSSHLIQWGIVYTPSSNFYGLDEIKYTVTNPVNSIPESNEGTIAININSQNDAPLTIIDIPDQQINEDYEGNIINLNSFFGDIDGDQLEYSASSTDNSMIILEVNEEFLSIVPHPNVSGGPITVSVVASDMHLDITQNFDIVILSINDAPTATNLDYTVLEDETLLIFPEGSDIENDPLTFMIFNPPQNGTAESDGNVFTYIPDLDYDGEDQFTFRANDGSLSSDIATVTITVESVNDAPVFSEITDQSTYEDTDFIISLNAIDPDNDEISFSYDIVDDFDITQEVNVLTISPPDNYNGDVVIQVYVSDGELTDSDSFVLTVIPVNDAPEIDDVIDQSVDEDHILVLNLSASDLDNDELSFFSSPFSNASSFVIENILTVVPDENFFGEIVVYIQVSDGELVDSDSFILTVNSIPDPPQISSIEDQEIQEGEFFSYTVTLTDPDGDDVYLTGVSVDNPEVETDFINDEISITFPENLNGEFEVLVTASDGALSAQELFLLSVLAVNDPPVSYSMNLSTVEDVSLVLILDAFDVDNLELTFIASAPSSGMIELNGSIVTYIPGTNYNGQDSFEFWASDGEFDSNISDVVIEIIPVNDSPIIISEPVTEAFEDLEYNYQVIATDPEEDILTFELIHYPDGMGISQSGLISWVPTEGIFSGEVTISVEDGGEDDSQPALQTYIINVEGVNDIPTIISEPPLTAIEDQEYTYQVEVYDPDSDVFYYAMLIPPPDGFVISDQGLITWTPTDGVISSGTIALAVWDVDPNEAQMGVDHPDLQQFVISVTPVNDAPIIVSTPAINASEDTEYLYQVLVEDIDSDVFMYELVNFPEGMLIDQSGLLSWTPLEGVTSSGLITLQVSDGGADNVPPAVQSFAISVTVINDPPIITSTAPSEGRQGEEYIYHIIVEDPDDNQFSYILFGAPDDMEIDFSTGILTWTPTSGGIYGPITLKVLDGGEDFSSPAIEIFSINVEYLSGPTTVVINLHEDFNLISYSAIPENNSVENVLSSLGTDAISILTEGLASVQLSDGWVGSLNNIVPERGYWIRTPEFIESDSIIYTIENAIPTNMDFLYEIHPDYNLISYVGLDGVSIGQALPDDIEDSIISIVGEGVAAVHLSDGWVGSLEALYRNKGYWLRNASETDTLYFSWEIPNEELLMLSGTIPKKKIDVPDFLSFNQSSKQAFYFIKDVNAKDFSIKSEDWIVAFSGDVIVGARQWNGSFTDVPVMGYDGTEITIGYCEQGDVPEFKLYISSRDHFIPLTGNTPSWVDLSTPIISELSEIDVLPEVFSLNNPYPNPFNPSTEISFSVPIHTNASVIVYDLLGQEVDIIADKYFSPGYHSIVWSPNNISSGMYFIRLMSDDISIAKKVMFIK